MTEYYLVDVKSIQCNVPRSKFKVDDLDRLAQSILASGGLMAPLLLRQVDLEHYEVLSGDYEYYAAVRAREIDPRAGEMVNAFVVSSQHQEAAKNQVVLLNQSAVTSIPSTDHSSVSELRLTNLESRLNEAIRDIQKAHAADIKRLEQEISQVKDRLPQPIEPLQAFNTLSVSELAEKLKAANLKGRTAESLIAAIEMERKQSQFTSLSNVVERIKGLGEKRMLSIVNAWK